MAKYVITSVWKLNNFIDELKREYDKSQKKEFNVSYEVSSKPKTKKQLGFIWGLIIPCIQKALEERYGKEYDESLISEVLYSQCSMDQILEMEDPKTGEMKKYVVQKRMSNMTIEEMSEFITQILDWCDYYEIVLPSECRYLWIYTLDPRYIEEVSQYALPDTDEDYKRYIQRSHCLISGEFGCDAHHFKTQKISGLGKKSPDWACVPIKHRIHVRQDGHITSAEIMRYCPFLFDVNINGKIIEPETVLKLCYDRYLNHR